MFVWVWVAWLAKKNRETKSGVKFAAFKRFSGPREMLGKTYYFS